jgi:hypothetical protein
MPRRYSTDIMSWPDMLSAGQSVTPYAPLWLQPNPTTGEQTLSLSAVDEGPDSTVQFFTTAEITGQSLADLPHSAVCRIFCMYVVMHLSEKYLTDACHSLSEIYSWQIGEGRPHRLPSRAYHTVSEVAQRERAPFVYDD